MNYGLKLHVQNFPLAHNHPLNRTLHVAIIYIWISALHV